MMAWLEEIKQRAEKATPGPWKAKQVHSAGAIAEMDCLDANDDWEGAAYWLEGPAWIDLEDEGLFFQEQDVKFIAHAREDIPFLIAQVEQLRRIIAELRHIT